jgi:hypothetical protein
MREHSVDGVWELTENTIDALVYIKLGLIVHSISVFKFVVLQGVRVHGQIASVHLCDEIRVGIRDLAMVPVHLLIGKRVRIHDPLSIGSNTMGYLTNLVKIIERCAFIAD